MTRLHRPYLLLALALPFLLVACADDDDPCATTNCPSGLTCSVGVDGEPVCAVDSGDTGNVVTCGAGEHRVENICAPNYTSSDVCDPWRLCRLACGTRVACLDACESDRTSACATCSDNLLACETQENCTSGPYAESCCFADYCTCFPEHPNCGNVPPCDECAEAAGDDTAAFSACLADEPACSTCLTPFFECQDSGGGSCESAFCDCTTCP